MKIIEQSVTPKNPERKSEDGIVATDDYVAVVDGSTSKSAHRYSLFATNGRHAMRIVCDYIRRAPGNLTCRQFCHGATAALARRYSRKQLAHLAEHPEDRLAASAVVFSRLNREIWLIGDCQCMVDGIYYDNPKPDEATLAQIRGDLIRQSPKPWDHFLDRDTAREAMLPHMLQSMRGQNVSYAVIDGFPIPQRHVRTVTLDFSPHHIILASDGYVGLDSFGAQPEAADAPDSPTPPAMPTLQQLEQLLGEVRRRDPLNIALYPATKGFMNGLNSFDDRAYIRFKV